MTSRIDFTHTLNDCFQVGRHAVAVTYKVEHVITLFLFVLSRAKQDVRACVQHAYLVDVVCGVVQHYRGTRTVPFLRTRLNYSNTYYEYY